MPKFASKLFSSVGLSSRLYALLLFSIGVLVAVGYLGYQSVESSNRSLANVYQRQVELNTLNALLQGYSVELTKSANDIYMGEMAATSGLGKLEAIDNRIREHWQLLQQAAAGRSDESTNFYDQIARLRDEINSTDDRLDEALRKEDLFNFGVILNTQLLPRINELTGVINRLIEHKTNLSESEYRASNETLLFLQYTLVGSILTFGLISFVIFRSVISGVTEPIKRVVSQFDELSRGRLETRLDIRRNDEIGHLAYAMDRFSDDLQNTAVASLERFADGNFDFDVAPKDERDVIGISLRKTLANLGKLIRETQSAVAKVYEDAERMAEISGVLATAADEQTNAINAMTASVGAANEKTISNARYADNADRIVSLTRKEAEKGAKQVEEMVDAMQELTVSAQEITNITKTINTIAMQTNLVALNAAVEASRAGDVGRGFAVVAEKVRDLAVQSQVAAKDTNERVSRSVESINNGIAMAEETALAFQEIQSYINKVSELVREIAAGSKDQAERLELISKSVVDIEAITTNYNDTSSQSTAAAEALAAQAGTINTLLGKFRVRND